MTASVYLPLITALWLGAVLAISFMESWLKFRAKGMTREIGLSAGRLIFYALNRIEWAMFAICLSLLFGQAHTTSDMTLLCGVFFVLAIQTFILLPALDKRAARIIAGAQVTATSHHKTFILFEIFKVILLSLLSLSLVCKV